MTGATALVTATQRPHRQSAWTGIEDNDVGMHEFIELCELINTERLIAVNTGFRRCLFRRSGS